MKDQAQPNQSTEAKQLLTIRDVAAILNISQPTIWRHVKAQTFPAPIAIGGVKRWRRSDIEAIYARQPVTQQ